MVDGATVVVTDLCDNLSNNIDTDTENILSDTKKIIVYANPQLTKIYTTALKHLETNEEIICVPEKKLAKINIKIAGIEKKVAEKKAKKLAKKKTSESPASVNN